MEQLILQPIRSVGGQIQLPGSKSLSNRVLLLSALAQGDTEVSNLLDSDDTRHMIAALRSLGTNLQLSEDGTHCSVQGLGGPFPARQADLYLGASGTDIRLLCSAVCLGQGVFTLTGEPRMAERPIKDLVEALTALGASIEYLQEEGFPPLRIHASGLAGPRVSIRGSISSQYLTSLLSAAPLSRQELRIEVDGELVSKPYIDLTLDVMRRFGVPVLNEDYHTFLVPEVAGYRSPGNALVEGDASSATYFLSAAAIKGGTVRVNGVGSDSVQGDIKHADILEQMGAEVRRGPDWIEVSAGQLRGIDVDLNHMPDAAMTVAATALFAEGKTVIRNIYNWRVKETDRLAAMASELRKVGAEVVEGRDYLEITPPDRIQSAEIDTYNDHRIAMCFSLAALGDAEITINNPGCVSKTFPDYFEKFETIARS
ncbi:MAG: 3-phosphoshikimate 1-carboxyvinyltransferase [Stenotrophomonas maltophilia]